MPFAYSSEFREMVLDQIRAGRTVAELARELERHKSSLHRWKREDRGASRGVVGFEVEPRCQLPGVSSAVAMVSRSGLRVAMECSER